MTSKMNISVSGLHLRSDPKDKEYAQKKTSRLIKYDSRITDIKVRLFSEKAHRSEDHDYYCEITVHVPGKILEIVDRERSLDKAIDKAVERMKRVIVRHKEKVMSKQHKEGTIRKFIRRLKDR